MFNPLIQYNDFVPSDTAAYGIFGAIMAFLLAFLVIFLLIAVAFYIYSSLALMKVAQRTKTGPAWLAWIPIGNIYLMSKIAKMPWWPILLLLGTFVPVVGFLLMIGFMIYLIMCIWKVCEARGKPGWWAILVIIPVIGPIWGLVMWGILAWGK